MTIMISVNTVQYVGKVILQTETFKKMKGYSTTKPMLTSKLTFLANKGELNNKSNSYVIQAPTRQYWQDRMVHNFIQLIISEKV